MNIAKQVMETGEEMITESLVPDGILFKKLKYTDEKFNPNTSDNLGHFRELCDNLKTLDYLPFADLDIPFSSDEWDFTPMVTNEYQQTRLLNLKFVNAHYKYKDILKFYTYYCATRDKIKIQTLRRKVLDVSAFTRYLGDKYIFSLDFVTLDIFKDYINHLIELGLTPGTIRNYTGSLKDFYLFYETKMATGELLVSHKEVADYYNKILTEMGAYQDLPVENRTQDIPNDFFDSYLSTAIKVMDSENAPIDRRGYASMIVLASQTGLRLSQLITLKINTVRTISILDNTKKAHFMKFVIIKRRGGNNSYEEAETILNDLGYKAYTTLVSIYDKERKKRKTDYLFCPIKAKEIPISDGTFRDYLKRFCIVYGKEIGCVNVYDKYPELSTFTIGDVKRTPNAFQGYGYKDTDVISYVTTHQFRVHLCTELYFKNIPLSIIKHYMNHLSEDMADYYVRRPEYSKKDEEYAEAVLKVIVEEGAKPLGGNSKALMTKIDALTEKVKKGEFNFSKDTDTVISELKRRMPIKQKLGGICIKSGPKRECSKDANTDEFYCAYGVCPNHFHLYTMLDITYQTCKDLLKSMKHNEKNGFTKQASKEKNKLTYVTNASLIPELKQLKEQLDKKGSEWIKEHHNNLIEIIDNIDTITEEANSWIS